jgi:hypothetical protein
VYTVKLIRINTLLIFLLIMFMDHSLYYTALYYDPLFHILCLIPYWQVEEAVDSIKSSHSCLAQGKLEKAFLKSKQAIIASGINIVIVCFILSYYLNTSLLSIPAIKQYIILYFTLIFSLFVFVSEPVHIAVSWPGPVNIMFSSGFCPNSFLVLDIQ